MRKFRVSLMVPVGTPAAMVKQVVEGSVVEADGFRIEDGALVLFSLSPMWKPEVIDAGAEQQYVDYAVIVYAAGVWRTVTPVVGATDQPTENTHENPRGHGQKGG